MRVLAGVIAALVALGACQSPSPPAGDAPPATFDAPIGPLSEAEIWRVDPHDTITHIQSGANCPKLWGGLMRDKLTIFRPNGMDIGCSYAGPAGSATVLTFYVFTSVNGGLDAELKVGVDSMRARTPTAKEAPFHNPPTSSEYRSHALSYASPDGTRMRTSLLVGQVNGGWLVKIRLTCREEDARKMEEAAGQGLVGQADRLRTRPIPRATRSES
jgi:hypothetical protein